MAVLLPVHVPSAVVTRWQHREVAPFPPSTASTASHASFPLPALGAARRVGGGRGLLTPAPLSAAPAPCSAPAASAPASRWLVCN